MSSPSRASRAFKRQGVPGMCLVIFIAAASSSWHARQGDERALLHAVRRQPVSVAIMASQRQFQLYMGGVFDDDGCGTELDHGVLITGYGRDNRTGKASGPPTIECRSGVLNSLYVNPLQGYWLVKNSWGSGWGEGGYIRMAMGVPPQGLCGLATMPSYPVKTRPNPPPTPPRQAGGWGCHRLSRSTRVYTRAWPTLKPYPCYKPQPARARADRLQPLVQLPSQQHLLLQGTKQIFLGKLILGSDPYFGMQFDLGDTCLLYSCCPTVNGVW